MSEGQELVTRLVLDAAGWTPKFQQLQTQVRDGVNALVRSAAPLTGVEDSVVNVGDAFEKLAGVSGDTASAMQQDTSTVGTAVQRLAVVTGDSSAAVQRALAEQAAGAETSGQRQRFAMEGGAAAVEAAAAAILAALAGTATAFDDAGASAHIGADDMAAAAEEGAIAIEGAAAQASAALESEAATSRAVAGTVAGSYKTQELAAVGFGTRMRETFTGIRGGLSEVKSGMMGLGMGLLGGAFIASGVSSLAEKTSAYTEMMLSLIHLGLSPQQAERLNAVTAAVNLSGTDVIRMLARLDKAASPATAKVDDVAQAVTDFGVSLTDAKGKPLPLAEQIDRLTKAWDRAKAGGKGAEFQVRVLGRTTDNLKLSQAELIKTVIDLDKHVVAGAGTLTTNQKMLEKWNVSLVDAKGNALPMIEQLKNMAAGFEAAAEKGQQLQFLSDVLGPKGQLFAPLLERYSTLSEAAKNIAYAPFDPKRLAEEQKKFAMFQMQMQQFEVSVGEQVIPIFGSLFDGAKRFGDELHNGVVPALQDTWDHLSGGAKIVGGLAAAWVASKLLSIVTGTARALVGVGKGIAGLSSGGLSRLFGGSGGISVAPLNEAAGALTESAGALNEAAAALTGAAGDEAAAATELGAEGGIAGAGGGLTTGAGGMSLFGRGLRVLGGGALGVYGVTQASQGHVIGVGEAAGGGAIAGAGIGGPVGAIVGGVIGGIIGLGAKQWHEAQNPVGLGNASQAQALAAASFKNGYWQVSPDGWWTWHPGKPPPGVVGLKANGLPMRTGSGSPFLPRGSGSGGPSVTQAGMLHVLAGDSDPTGGGTTPASDLSAEIRARVQRMFGSLNPSGSGSTGPPVDAKAIVDTIFSGASAEARTQAIGYANVITTALHGGLGAAARETQGFLDDTRQRTKEWVDANRVDMGQVGRDADDLQVHIHGVQTAYANLPDSVTTTLHVDTSDAQSTVDAFIAHMKKLGIDVSMNLDTSLHGGASGHAEGGLIGGALGTGDSRIARVSPGEYVVKALAVQKYGTHMFDLLNARRFAEGGLVDGIDAIAGGLRTTALSNLFLHAKPPPMPTISIPGGGHVPTGAVAAIVQAVAASFGWGSGAEWQGIVNIINAESGWNPTAQNPTSSAYGLFQFLDATWGSTPFPKTSDAYRQAVDGMVYIKERYGDPIHAWAYHAAHHNYGTGGRLPEDVVGMGVHSGDQYRLHGGEWVVPRELAGSVASGGQRWAGGNREPQVVKFTGRITNWREGMMEFEAAIEDGISAYAEDRRGEGRMLR